MKRHQNPRRWISFIYRAVLKYAFQVFRFGLDTICMLYSVITNFLCQKKMQDNNLPREAVSSTSLGI
jgi:hypothetical protein